MLRGLNKLKLCQNVVLKHPNEQCQKVFPYTKIIVEMWPSTQVISNLVKKPLALVKIAPKEFFFKSEKTKFNNLLCLKMKGKKYEGDFKSAIFGLKVSFLAYSVPFWHFFEIDI